MYKFEAIDYMEWKPELQTTTLFEEHWDEVGSKGGKRILEVSWESYDALYEADVLLIIGAFYYDELVGYAVNMFGVDTHSKHCILSTNDALYLHPQHRKARVGLTLMKTCEEKSRDMGATHVLWHAKPNTTLQKLLEAKQYKVKDIMYSREL
jgi:predicted GNAT superfamily acetyltransferase